jgi:hypothetical protein
VSHFSEAGYWPALKSYETNQILFSPVPTPTQRCQDSIEFLRLRLKQLNAWPAAGDTFLELLDQAKDYGVTLVPTDFDWLARVADDAFRGEDIGSRYPSIFHKLLTFPELRKKFLQLLQLRTADT